MKTSVFVLSALALVLAGCGGGSNASAEKGTISMKWNRRALAAVRATATGPTVTSRALAIVNTAMYDAWAAYDDDALGSQLGGTLRRPSSEWTLANKQKAVSYAAYRALVDLFPSRKSDFDAYMNDLGLDPNNTTTDLATPAGVGNVAAQALIDFRHNDGSNQLGNLGGGAPYRDYTGYTPVNTVDNLVDPGRWQPQRFVFPDASTTTPGYLTPQWDRVTPFALTSTSQFRPPAPAPLGSSAWLSQIDELIQIQANLTDRQKVIADYWANGPRTETPPGHWFLFADWVAERDDMTLDETVKLGFALGNAVMDAGIACWEAKRVYDYARPISAIRYQKNGQTITGWRGPGQGIGPINGENWKPYQPASFITPPFPEHTSGHSTFSAAAGEILKRFTGSDSFGNSVVLAPGSNTVEPGTVPASTVVLSWNTFTAAVEEAGMSRLYGGIHFSNANTEGQTCGRQVGTAVWNKCTSLWGN